MKIPLFLLFLGPLLRVGLERLLPRLSPGPALLRARLLWLLGLSIPAFWVLGRSMEPWFSPLLEPVMVASPLVSPQVWEPGSGAAGVPLLAYTSRPTDVWLRGAWLLASAGVGIG